VCEVYARISLQSFLVLRAPQSDRFSEVKCMGKSLCEDVQAVRLKCHLITSNSSIALNVDGGS
jgi:hypothetical protein